MIIRTWCGQTTAANASAYERHVTENVFPGLAEMRGHRGAKVLRRQTSNGIEFLVMTYWDSMEAIRQFAGPHVETAVVAAEARALLSGFDTFVHHYELVHDSTRSGDPLCR